MPATVIDISTNQWRGDPEGDKNGEQRNGDQSLAKGKQNS
jgi:hypothetical protein